MTFGVMFHHFHGRNHPKSQGSIDADQLRALIKRLQKDYTILNASEYLQYSIAGELQPKHICLTFDDGLRSQFDIAVPVLESLGIFAFFFIYSGPFVNIEPKLEIYRDFRCTRFDDIEDFYENFFELVKSEINSKWSEVIKKFKDRQYLVSFSFYSDNDRLYRFLRDIILDTQEFDRLMDCLMEKHSYSRTNARKSLIMAENNLVELEKNMHVIGLHSLTHPTTMDQMPIELQRNEYVANCNHLSRVLQRSRIESMSHPCGRYDDATNTILQNLGVKLGFRSDALKLRSSPYEYARIDHTDLVRKYGL